MLQIDICQLCGHFDKVIAKKLRLKFSEVDNKKKKNNNTVTRYDIIYLDLDLLSSLNFCRDRLMEMFNLLTKRSSIYFIL